MSYETPRLTSGVFADQEIWRAVTSPVHPVGTRGQMSDGRSFYYACNRGAAISAGFLCSAASISVDFDDLATNTAEVGDVTVNVTPVGTATYALNQLEGGFLSINSGASGNDGRQYRIIGNPATTAATAFNLTLESIREEAFVAATTGTVVPNPYSSVVLADVSADLVSAGVTTFDVPAGSTDPQYFWLQTWGIATLRADVAGDIVGHALVKGTTEDGSFIGYVNDNAGVSVDQIEFIGTNLFTSVDADFMPVLLKIMP